MSPLRGWAVGVFLLVPRDERRGFSTEHFREIAVERFRLAVAAHGDRVLDAPFRSSQIHMPAAEHSEALIKPASIRMKLRMCSEMPFADRSRFVADLFEHLRQRHLRQR